MDIPLYYLFLSLYGIRAPSTSTMSPLLCGKDGDTHQYYLIALG